MKTISRFILLLTMSVLPMPSLLSSDYSDTINQLAHGAVIGRSTARTAPTSTPDGSLRMKEPFRVGDRGYYFQDKMTGMNMPNIPPQGYIGFAITYKLANLGKSVFTPGYGENMRLQDDEGNVYAPSIAGGENAECFYNGKMQVFPTELYPGYELQTVVVFVIPGRLYAHPWKLLVSDSSGKETRTVRLSYQ
ncbi:MAG: hypothetical protein WCP60_06195 [bacterium]